jgi:hypothetical protein
MTKLSVELEEEDWARLLNAAALAPYVQIAVVLAKVQLQLQPQTSSSEERISGNGRLGQAG